MSKVTTGQFGDKHTPEQVLIDALEYSEDIEIVVVVSIRKDETISTSWSNGSSLTRAGLCQWAIKEMFDENE